MKKFYRYIIYSLYTWRVQKKDNTPVATVIILLTVTHIFQLMSIYSILRVLFQFSDYLIKLNRLDYGKMYIVAFVFIFALLHYILVYNKERWQRYIDEFKSESEEDSKRGMVLVGIYLWGSVLLFFILIPLLSSL